ncbi:hypothetical protein [Streptomyces californicus]|uniref:hypothetical protein n=1 Tax=Streptomyces californicus TaxID=67351 RepID=UPI0037A3526C
MRTITVTTTTTVITITDDLTVAKAAAALGILPTLLDPFNELTLNDLVGTADRSLAG